MSVVIGYTGPECPRCHVALTAEWNRSGTVACPYCSRSFEATAFEPPVKKTEPAAVRIAEAGPEGANACANHARNAATASCQRCGLFICSLCDMNVGNGSFCPSCFDRVRAEGTLQSAAKRYRDYAGVARAAAISGIPLTFIFLSIPCGAIALYYGIKARAQRRAEGRSLAGVTIIAIFGVLEILVGIVYIGFMIYVFSKEGAT